MAKSANKTQETKVDVATFLRKIGDSAQRADAAVLITLLESLSGAPAKMWGPSIIGFGRYHYRYESGREGEMCLIGFSPRKSATVLYAKCDAPAHNGLLKRLGKHKAGKGCIYIKRLSDIDMDVLEELCEATLEHMREKYPQA